MSARMKTSWKSGLALATILIASVPATTTSAESVSLTPRARVRGVETDDLGLTSLKAIAYASGRALFFALEPGSSPEHTRITTLTPLDDPLGSVEIPVALSRFPIVAFDDRGNRLLMVDEAGDLHSFDLLADGRIDASSGRMLEMPRVGPLRVAGMTADPATGDVYVLDRLSRRVVRFVPGAEADASGSPSWMPIGRLAELDLRGLAWNPISQSLHLLEPDAGVLYEITTRGELVKARDLREAGLGESGSMVFAPSRDQTDDPAVQDLFVNGPDAAGGGGLYEVSLAFEESLSLSATTAAPTVVRVIDTSRWTIPSPDCSGLAYHALSGRLLLVDGEVEEESYWKNVNYYELTLSGTYVRGANLISFSDEPVGVAVNTRTGQIIVTDDDADEIFLIDPGGDRVVGTADDRRTSFKSRNFGSVDPEGATYDSLHNKLYITDSENSEVYELAPGPNGQFDAVDDVVRHFDTARLGATDPECVEYHPSRGTLFAIGTGNTDIIEMTTSGALVAKYDVSFLADDHPSGMAFAPGSTNPSATNVYIAFRNQDNDSHSSENDGRIVELSFDASAAPPPSGGGSTLGTTIRIATGSDDAEENASGSVSPTGGDLELVFDGNNQVVGLRFPGVGVAQGARIDSAFVQFKADEAQNEATSLVFHGQAADDATTFTSASRNVSSRPKTTASVSWTPLAWSSGAAGGAQRSPNLAPILQEIVNRPGWSSGHAIVLVVSGTGHRTAESVEGDPSGAPQLEIRVGTGPVTNRAPTVDAGPNQAITQPSSVALDGTVSDDGLPAPPSLTTRWTGTGPGSVTFVNDRAVDTQASFGATGTYLLKLTASDGALTARDSVFVEVRAPGTTVTTVERRIAVGSDDAEEKLTGSTSLTSSDLELTMDGTAVQRVGLRFTGLAIPNGAVVTSAWIQFKVDEATSDATVLAIRAQATDNAATFVSTSSNIGTRPLTTATIGWTPAAWTPAAAAGAAQRTPDLSPLLNELVRRAGWTTSSPVVIVISGTGRRIAEAFEGDRAGAPLLHVEYRN
jgi:hypothetical protein